MTRILSLLTIYLIMHTVSLAQDTESVSKLPEYIPVIEGSIYLYADFNNIRKETIPVYLINNSDEDFNLTGPQIPLIQQEFRDNDSTWRRSQSYNYGWCGNQYFYNWKIKSKEFVTVHKSFPSKRIKKKVRYNFYGKDILHSNIGLGRINPDEVKRTEFDDVALYRYDSEFLIKIIKRKIIPFKEERKNDSLIRKTLMILRNKFPDQALVILKEIAGDPANKFYSLAVRNLKVLKESKLKK